MNSLHINMVQNGLIMLFILIVLYVFQKNSLFKLIGWIIVYLCITWYLIKYFRKIFNKGLISFKGKAVLITGCDHGFGHELAKKLNNLGFRVFACCLNPQLSSEKLKNYCTNPDKMHVLNLDVTKNDNILQVKQEVEKLLQENNEQLWTVVNNAEIFASYLVEWGKLDNLKKIFNVNVFGLVNVTRQLLPLIRQSKGRIINMASLAERLSNQNLSSYSMSKFAVVAFSDALRRELNLFSVKVITIEPEAYKTPMAAEELLLSTLDQIWNDTDQQVKSDYGSNFYYAARERIKSRKSGRKNICEVIDNIIDAIISIHPQTRYCCCGVIIKIGWFLVEHLPYEISDFLLNLIIHQRIIPRALDDN